MKLTGPQTKSIARSVNSQIDSVAEKIVDSIEVLYPNADLDEIYSGFMSDLEDYIQAMLDEVEF